MTIKASICIATYDKADLLAHTLVSIFRQRMEFCVEVIVVDDGSPGTATREVCDRFPAVQYHRIDRAASFGNPCTARNVAYRAARGKVIIAQSDEVVHVTPDAIQRLVDDLRPGTFLLANVFALGPNGEKMMEYCGPTRPKPFFFLGSLWRSDLYAVGGNDEDFACGPAYDDDWFADCLVHGLGLRPVGSTAIVGHHLYHEPRYGAVNAAASAELYARKHAAATAGEIPWCSAGGPWEME